MRQTLSCYRYTVVIQLVDDFDSIINSQQLSMNEQSSGDHLCYGDDTFIGNRRRRAAYHRTHDN